MLIESDLIIAYIKKSDWLKPSADKIFQAIQTKHLENIQISTHVIHELYYVFSDLAQLSIILSNAVKISTLDNITYVDTTREIMISALELISTYQISSVFDAIYAATALTNLVPDHVILSTDTVYDKIPGLKRIDPRELHISS